MFGLFLFITWARLFLQGEGASPPAFSFLALLMGSYLVACWAPGHSTPGRWRVRLLWYPAIMGISFSILPSSIHLLQTPSADGLLASLDRRLLGKDVSTLFEKWNYPLVTELMMGAYLFFFYYLIAGPGHYCVRNLPRFRECFAGLFTVYGMSFVGYTCWPATGPKVDIF